MEGGKEGDEGWEGVRGRKEGKKEGKRRKRGDREAGQEIGRRRQERWKKVGGRMVYVGRGGTGMRGNRNKKTESMNQAMYSSRFLLGETNSGGWKSGEFAI